MPYICVAEAIDFRKEICGGEEAIRKYCFGLARDGGAVISERLETEVMQNSGSVLDQCCFANVRLPLPFHQASGPDTEMKSGLNFADGPVITRWIMHRLIYEFDTWIPGKFYNGAN